MKYSKTLLITCLAGTLVSGCTTKESSRQVRKGIFSSEDMDLSMNPGDDFYTYANGGWKKNNPLPNDKARFGSFDKLREDNDQRVNTLIEELAKKECKPGSPAQKIGAFYKAGMDVEAIEKAGLAPLQPEFERINKISNKKEFIETVGYFHTIGAGGLFYWFGSADRENSAMTISYLWQGGLGMPDRDYYLSKDERSQKIREAYIDHLGKMFGLLGDSEKEAAANAQTIMTIETRLAQASMPRLDLRDPHKTLHKMPLNEVKQHTSNIQWDSYLAQIGLSKPGIINLSQPDFFKELNSMIKEVSIKDWKTYLRWNLVNSTANYLPKAFVKQDFEFYGKTLSGKLEMEPRWKRVVNSTNGALGEVVGQEFVQKYFPAEAKTRMKELVGNLRIALGQRIEQLDWMSDETKTKAKEKLDVIRVKIGYPDKWRDYSELEISDASFLTNVLNSRRFDHFFEINKIGKPVDRDEWGMTPQTVNAYYNGSNNEIVFPAAILQPPFFYLDGDDAVNYGAIGVVIGHEITHGFDDKGRLFDKNGNLNTWWTKEDAQRFNEKTQILVNQFNNFTVLDTIHANGSLTLGENIADLGGLNISHQAFLNSLKGKEEPAKIDGFTAEQRFVLAYARVWAQNIRDKEILRLTKVDVHSLGHLRVNGPLPNVDFFYQAFNIEKDAPIFIPKEDRAIIW